MFFLPLPLLFLIPGLTLLILGLFLRFKKKENPAQPISQKVAQSLPSPPKKNYLADIFFFFGTQSGTAEKFCNILAQEAEEQGFQGKVVDLEEYEKYDMKTKNCVFCVATHGEGEPSDNAKMFYKFLKENEQENNVDKLKGMMFAVFGLGNKQYQHYNSMGRSINRLLLKLGGEIMYKYGEGDDSVALEDDFNAWKEGIWDELKTKLLGEKEQKNLKQMKMAKEMEEFSKELQPPASNPLPKSGFALVPTSLPALSLDTYTLPSSAEFDFQTKVFFETNVVKLLKIKEIRQNTIDGSTLHLEISTEGKMQYRTAQNLAVIPENNEDKVLEVGDYLGLSLHQTVVMEGAGGKRGKAMFPTPIKVTTILKNFCDFQGVIMKRVLKDLAKIANGETKKKLEFLSSNEGKQAYKDEIESNMITLISLLKMYKIKPTLEEFVSLCPRITPRYFTISSSNLLHPQVVHITASILKDSLRSGQSKTGLVSKYFEDLQAISNSGKEPTIRIAFKSSNFVLPYERMQNSLINGTEGDILSKMEESKEIPVIMIGGGVGVAPFRAFLQEKEFLMEKGKVNKGEMEMTLFFGCKHEEGDNIFREEFKGFKERGILNNFYSAYSRDQAEKIYVQHLIKKNGRQFYETLITRKGVVYMCGSTAMGRDVMSVIENIILENEGLTQEEVKTRIVELESGKKIIKEVWG